MSPARQARTELTLQGRYGILYAATAVVILWAIVLWALQPPLRAFLLPPLLVMDTAVFGFFLMSGMMFLEKNDGVLAALVVTPMSTRTYLLRKVLVLTAVAVVLSLVLVGLMLGNAVNWLWLTAGIAFGSVMTMLAGFVLATRFNSISQYLIPASLIMIVVQVPALHYFNLVPSDLFYLLPTMAPLVLVEGAFTGLTATEAVYGIAYSAVTCLLLLRWAVRAFDRFVAGGQAAASRPVGSGSTPPRSRTPRSRNRILALLAGDVRNIRREPILAFLSVYALILATVGRWLIPWLVEVSAPFDFTPYVLLLVTFLAVQTGPLVLGAVAGMLLLDERDDRSLLALRATPLPLRHYVVYRTAVPVALSALLCFASVYFVALVDASGVRVAVVAVIAALEGPILALAVAGMANNKVEGMALLKGMGIFMFAPVAAYFLETPWRWALGVFPTFWPAELFWQAVEPYAAYPELSFWATAVAGLGIHLLLLAWLLRRFEQKI